MEHTVAELELLDKVQRETFNYFWDGGEIRGSAPKFQSLSWAECRLIFMPGQMDQVPEKVESCQTAKEIGVRREGNMVLLSYPIDYCGHLMD